MNLGGDEDGSSIGEESGVWRPEFSPKLLGWTVRMLRRFKGGCHEPS